MKIWELSLSLNICIPNLFPTNPSLRGRYTTVCRTVVEWGVVAVVTVTVGIYVPQSIELGGSCLIH